MTLIGTKKKKFDIKSETVTFPLTLPADYSVQSIDEASLFPPKTQRKSDREESRTRVGLSSSVTLKSENTTSSEAVCLHAFL